MPGRGRGVEKAQKFDISSFPRVLVKKFSTNFDESDVALTARLAHFVICRTLILQS